MIDWTSDETPEVRLKKPALLVAALVWGKNYSHHWDFQGAAMAAYATDGVAAEAARSATLERREA